MPESEVELAPYLAALAEWAGYDIPGRAVPFRQFEVPLCSATPEEDGGAGASGEDLEIEGDL